MTYNILINNEVEQKYCFRFKYKKFAYTTVLLPLAGFAICVCVSIWKDFEAVNFTHCQVYNVLPSVSAAIGTFYPQNLIWKWTIGIHTLPRYFLAFIYYHFNKSIIKEAFHFILFFANVLNFIEISSLFGLSFWSSTTNYPVHKSCFVTFVITSELYMLMLCYLLRSHRHGRPTEIERKSLKLKFILVVCNITSILLASYFFVRHNTHCEPWIYSLFAGCEYLVILTNMAYHITSCHEIGHRHVYVHSGRIVFR